MFENQQPRTGAPATAPTPTRIPPPPIRTPMPSAEPADIFAGTAKSAPRMGQTPPPAAMPPKRGGRKIALVFIIIIIAILLLAGGVLAYLSFMRQAPTPNVNAMPNTNIVTNVNANANENVNANLNTNVNANENANANLNLPPIGGTGFTIGQDADLDGLTDAEEDLYGTNKDNSDTDGDGYQDGAELIGLFDPTKGSGALLKDSDIVKLYENPTYGYSVLYPAKWQAIALGEGTDLDRQVTFSASPVTSGSESIQISIEDNATKAGLFDWLLLKEPNILLPDYLRETSKGGFDYLRNMNNLIYYLTKEWQLDKIYAFSYIIGTDRIINDLSTIQMMINSFNLK